MNADIHAHSGRLRPIRGIALWGVVVDLSALLILTTGCAPQTQADQIALRKASRGIVSSSQRVKRTSEDLDTIIARLLPEMVDCPATDRYAAMPCANPAMTKLSRWAEREMFIEYVQSGAPCQLPASDPDFGRICCVSGSVSWFGGEGRSITVTRDGSDVYAQLARSVPSGARGNSGRLCGVVAGRQLERSGNVPMMVGMLMDQ
jgi:hypothetical protein